MVSPELRPFGATYDVNHITKAMNTVQNYVWTPTYGPLYFHKDDVLRFAWANAESKTYGMIVKYRRI
jgi:hypothetical protein